jgi:hypothetical protein
MNTDDIQGIAIVATQQAICMAMNETDYYDFKRLLGRSVRRNTEGPD